MHFYVLWTLVIVHHYPDLISLHDNNIKLRPSSPISVAPEGLVLSDNFYKSVSSLVKSFCFELFLRFRALRFRYLTTALPLTSRKMRAQLFLTSALLMLRVISAHPVFPEIKRSEIDNTKSIAHQDIKRDEHDHSLIARDLFLPAAINEPIPLLPSLDLPGITSPYPAAPTAPPATQPVNGSSAAAVVTAPTTASGLSQLGLLPFPLFSTTATQEPGTTTLAILSLPGLVIVPFTVATSSGPAAFSGVATPVATPVASALAINPVSEEQY